MNLLLKRPDKLAEIISQNFLIAKQKQTENYNILVNRKCDILQDYYSFQVSF